MTNNFGKKGRYNSQEIGLARGLSEYGHTVKVIKCVKDNKEVGKERINENADIEYKKCCYLGSNGIMKTTWLDNDADIVVQFADLQLSVPKVYKWCTKHKIKYIPYVGITSSHANNSLVKILMDVLFRRNLHIYKNNGCVVKNEDVYNGLRKKGVVNQSIAPVCLDVEQFKNVNQDITKEELRKKWGIGDERIILFIGRLEEEKHPLEAIKIIDGIKDKSARLMMVGQGVLREQIEIQIKERKLEDRVNLIERVDYKDIWQLYKLSDVYINLCPIEIWGMTILEAMYYGIGVISLIAPGPNMMIIDGETGFLADSYQEIIHLLDELVEFDRDMLKKARDRVLTDFSWKRSADVFLKPEKYQSEEYR